MLTTSPRAKWYFRSHSRDWKLRLRKVELLAQGHASRGSIWTQPHQTPQPSPPFSHSSQPSSVCQRTLPLVVRHWEATLGRMCWPAQEGIGWVGAVQEGSDIQYWVHHRESNSTSVIRPLPSNTSRPQVRRSSCGPACGPHPSGKGGLRSAHLPQAQYLPQMLLLLLRALARASAPAPQSPLSRRSSRLT